MLKGLLAFLLEFVIVWGDGLAMVVAVKGGCRYWGMEGGQCC